MAQKPLTLSAPLTFSADDPSADLPSRFDGLAYAGGLIAHYEPTVIDLAGLVADVPMPLLYEHAREMPVGTVKAVSNTGAALSVTGELFSAFDDEARSIAQKAQAGMPWQMSVGVYDYAVESVPATQSVAVNGQTFSGPLVVLRRAVVREVSIVALGADADTSVTLFSHHQPEGGPPMSDANAARVAELEAHAAELEAENASLKAAALARETADREAAVAEFAAVLGREPGDAYAALSAAQLRALAADLSSQPASGQPPAYLFSEHAAGKPAAPAVNPLIADARRRAGK